MAEQTTYYQSRHTGEEIDRLLDNSIAATAAANTAAEGANTAAQAAQDAAAQIPERIAGKADLDPATGCVVSAQLAPLAGRQQGVQMNGGVFRSDDAALCFDGDRTVAALFITGEDVTTEQMIYNDRSDGYNNGIYIEFLKSYLNVRACGQRIGYNSANQKELLPHTLNLVVVSFQKGGQSLCWHNGLQTTHTATDQSTYSAPNTLLLGRGIRTDYPAKCRILSLRLFDYALTAEEAAALWNFGAPDRFMLPPTGAMRAGLMAEYIAAGALPDRWRDTSGHGLHLPFVPATAGETAQLDYRHPPLTPSGSPLHDLFVAAGAVWVEATKSWTVADYTGIDNQTMTKIYERSRNIASSIEWTGSLLYATIPVNLPPRVDITGYNGVSIRASAAFAGSKIEKAYLAINDNTSAGIVECRNMFRGCSMLRTVVGIVFLSDNVLINTEVFAYCPLLERVRIKNLRTSLTFAHSPLLSLESLRYLVENAANTAAITVTVHAEVYAKLTDPNNADWLAVNTAAQAKNISFATA